MLTVRFEPLEERRRFRRHLSIDGQATPAEEVTLPVVPRYPLGPLGMALEERPRQELQALGQQLAGLALGDAGLAAVRRLRTRGPVRVAFEESAASAAAAALPWELLHDGTEFLAAHPRVHVVRTLGGALVVDEVALPACPRVLVAWSAPVDLTDVDVEWEQMLLSLALGPHLNRGALDVREVIHCTRAKLEEALTAQSYDVVYFTGHGGLHEGSGALCLEADDGTADPLTGPELARKLALLERPPALVFLNCCHSAAVAPERDSGGFLDVGRCLLGEGVPFVIGTSARTFVASAQVFMEGFVRTLFADGRFDVPRAVAAARGAVLDHGPEPTQRQAFFHHALLTSTAADWRCLRDPSPPVSADPPAPVHYVSQEYPGTGQFWVRRNAFLAAIEDAFLAGANVVGVCGTGGVGKTVLSSQILEHLRRHADPRLRPRRCLWLDLRRQEGLAGYLLQQLATILSAGGVEPVLGRRIQESPDLLPVPLARELGQAFGADCVCVLDNCESLLELQGTPLRQAAFDLVEALAGHTGWRCLLTSRERFSFPHEGRHPCPITWLDMGELTHGERGALLRRAAAEEALSITTLPRDLQRRIMEEIAGHPYELDLFLAEAARRPDDLEQLIDDVHARTTEYARLDYYVGRAPAECLPPLQLVAALDEPADMNLLGFLWNDVRQTMGWPGDDGLLGRAIAALADRSLLLHAQGIVSILPVLRHYLTAGGDGGSTRAGPHGLSGPQQDALHRQLALVLSAAAEQTHDAARQLLQDEQKREDEASQARAGALSQHRVELLHRAVRHALRQGDLEVAWHAQQSLARVVGGLVGWPALLAYARELVSRAEAASALAPDGKCPEDVGICFGVAGSTYLDARQWPEAQAAYERALEHFEAGGHDRHVGVTHHQVGMVWAEQREWSQALSNYEQAIASFQQTGQLHELGSTYHQVGRVWAEQREWSQALSSYCQAVEAYLAHGLVHPSHMTITLRQAMRVIKAAARDGVDLGDAGRRFDRLRAERAEVRDAMERLRQEDGDAAGAAEGPG